MITIWFLYHNRKFFLLCNRSSLLSNFISNLLSSMDGCAKLLYKKAITSRKGDGNGKEGIISAKDILNYIIVKNKYSIYFSNVVIFPDMDQITNPLKFDLEPALDRAINELMK